MKPMLIEQKFPEEIKDTWLRTDRSIMIPANLRRCLEREASTVGIAETEINIILAALNNDFLNIRCFLHRITNLWCYELEGAHNLQKTKKLLWGSHIWPPVATLMKALHCAYAQLFKVKNEKDKFREYVQKLSDPKNASRHRDFLVEMWPLLRVSEQINTEFEVQGYGLNNTNIDWLLKLPTRLVLIDVKNRIDDLYSQMDKPDPTKAPQHDPSLLFRSLERKFNFGDPDVRLQGVWIVTQVKQNSKKLHDAFNKLDKGKVHFAILGDDKEDAHILTRRDEDKSQLIELLKLVPSMRFTYL